MGLDMNLYRETHVIEKGGKPSKIRPERVYAITEEIKWEITTLKGGKPSKIRPERVYAITEEIAYWRKFNALHAFIVNNFAEGKDDCQIIYLYDDELQKIHDTLKKIHESKNDSLALELMPPSEGFFFGSYEIDEWYWKNVENAYKVFSEILSDGEETREYYYQASW
jgi:hypothetical protein